jgi:hypothetical protein
MSADGPDLDLGDGHTLTWCAWAPDRELNPQYANLPDIERAGATVEHDNPATGQRCPGFIYIDSPQARELFPGRQFWTVESWEPLTLSPSLLCSCGDHGFVREGRWVRA